MTIPLDAQRFAAGLSWPDYLAQMGDYRARTEENYRQCALTDDERQSFAGLTQPRYGLMIAENWCGDVHRNSPMLARIADAMPNLELRVLFRDANLDLTDCFLNNGYRSIPIMVFFDQDWNEIGRWSERPSRATTKSAALRAQTVDSAPPDQREAAIADFRKKMNEAYGGPDGLWRDTVKEIRQVLETRLGLLKPAT
ncbi:MAG: thioredoxin family protein [Chloroflexi bacterium]|nr:thioredoxin family protein [Chloroflexota bacterium]MBI3732247.1 thioredoxin family protein [Chloroflexota bacterium]